MLFFSCASVSDSALLWDQIVRHCSASTGFAVCFCPPGFYGTGLGQDGCDERAWTVSVPVSLDWVTSQDIARGFGERSSWVADEILLWQILLGKDTSDATGSNVPHYWLSSTKVSVLEASPGRHVAALYPLFQDNSTAQAARGRLMSYLAENNSTIMGGTALVHAINVSPWDGTVPNCPVESMGCTAESFPFCQDASGEPACECAGGSLPERVECSEVRECTLSHENCHINEVCRLSCDIDECANPANNDCDPNTQICINKIADYTSADSVGYECECQVGFVASGANCTDVDECDGDTNYCHATAQCKNTWGSTYPLFVHRQIQHALFVRAHCWTRLPVSRC